MNEQLIKEFTFSTSRSSGAGGQSVNKIETKVHLKFNVLESRALNSLERDLICQKLANRVDANGVFALSADSSRSQLANKKEVIKRALDMINDALIVPKKRKASKPTAASRKERKERKQQRSALKKSRNWKYGSD